MTLRLIVQVDGRRRDMGLLADGDRGIGQTLSAMRELIIDGAQNIYVRAVADALWTSTQPEIHRRATVDPRTISALVLNRLDVYIRERRVFVEDPEGVELLRHPADTLGMMRGVHGVAPIDCDDVAIVGAALMLAAGFKPVLIVAGTDPKKAGGRFRHVFFGVLSDPAGPLVKENILPFDPQERRPPGVWGSQDFVREGIVRVVPGPEGLCS